MGAQQTRSGSSDLRPVAMSTTTEGSQGYDGFDGRSDKSKKRGLAVRKCGEGQGSSHEIEVSWGRGGDQQQSSPVGLAPDVSVGGITLRCLGGDLMERRGQRCFDRESDSMLGGCVQLAALYERREAPVGENEAASERIKKRCATTSSPPAATRRSPTCICSVTSLSPVPLSNASRHVLDEPCGQTLQSQQMQGERRVGLDSRDNKARLWIVDTS